RPTTTPDIYTLSLHDALPIYRRRARAHRAPGRLLREPEAVPERGLLFRDHLRSDADSRRHVSRAVRHRANAGVAGAVAGDAPRQDRKSTRLNSSHVSISYAVF